MLNGCCLRIAGRRSAFDGEVGLHRIVPVEAGAIDDRSPGIATGDKICDLPDRPTSCTVVHGCAVHLNLVDAARWVGLVELGAIFTDHYSIDRSRTGLTVIGQLETIA